MRAQRFLCALALAGALLPAAATAQSFTILSQNMLRFGHGSRLLAQCNAITTASATVDIIVLQEVMQPGYPCLTANNKKGVNVPIPTNFAYVTSAAKGRSSYVEYYGILYRTNTRNNMQITLSGSDDTLSTTKTFMRPPFGALFQVTNTTNAKACSVWVVDIHSIFGKVASDRQYEATQMKTVYQNLMAKKTGSVIVAGDWNLAATDSGFSWVATNNASIQPNVLTSLTATGAPSSAYDHAVNTLNSTTPPSVTISQTTSGSWVYMGGMTGANWRKNISDHMGVIADVSLTC
ncbi:endonuclease/exonuclease/phosphatase family protein [Sphingomonas sp. KR3-1]|uniref:endonuclease/exonuclease/phosphatase family protein n=1 Tax=Sphingomonas sp. KR3-1 TaxID=3156611 RepID=UPI0032B4D23C